MAEESAAAGHQLEQVSDLSKTVLAVKIKELQEELFEIRKNTSGKYQYPAFLYKCSHRMTSIKIPWIFSILNSNQTSLGYCLSSAWTSATMGVYF